MLIFLYAAALAFFAFVIWRMAWRYGLLFFPIYFYIYLTLFHVLFPLVFLTAEAPLLRTLPRQQLLDWMTQWYFFLALFMVGTAAITFPLGWKVGGKIPLLVFRASSWQTRDVPEGPRAVAVSWVILLLGAVGFVLFFEAFGGIFNALAVARAFRTGIFEITNPWSFMRPIGDFTKVAMLLFVALWVSGRRSIPVLVGLVVALSLSFLMIFFQGGRLNMALHIAVLMILFISSGYLSMARAAIVGGVCAAVLFFGYQIFFFIYGLFKDVQLSVPTAVDQLSPIEFFFVELSFPSMGVATSLHAVSNGLIPLRYGSEVLQGILSILPAGFFDFGFTRIGALHTEISNPGGGATIPVDMMTYGVYSVYVLGPAVMAFLVGFCVRMVFRYLARIPWPKIRFALSVYFLFTLAHHLVYFDPSASINSVYFLVLCSIIVYFTSRPILRRYRAAPDPVPARWNDQA